MHTLQQILNHKKVNEIWHTLPDATVYDAIQMMADKKAGALLVMQGGALKGIISERDYAREVILKGRSSRETRVEEIMTGKVISVTSSESVEVSLAIMTKHQIRHLPIVDDDRVVGVVSIGDLVKDIISDQQSTIEQLENYIRS
ncbi:MAG TPA: histidine kinase [Gammaproteobacteria bacterium]|jgi:CBS domain-containing protein|nr:CBS domain-containing protein [Gammaproteobacteria bacterium]MDP6733284.1 CBS domain-containing protein [Gammaproteobacteria bacterium]HAJ75690.1 histidine kinase [Gammaproteobacteria bacterium]|tara:strand:+ start:131 stop:562 length:432 start_codon:yes stop_codon:yes gene_type:complete